MLQHLVMARETHTSNHQKIKIEKVNDCFLTITNLPCLTFLWSYSNRGLSENFWRELFSSNIIFEQHGNFPAGVRSAPAGPKERKACFGAGCYIEMAHLCHQPSDYELVGGENRFLANYVPCRFSLWPRRNDAPDDPSAPSWPFPIWLRHTVR